MYVFSRRSSFFVSLLRQDNNTSSNDDDDNNDNDPNYNDYEFDTDTEPSDQGDDDDQYDPNLALFDDPLEELAETDRYWALKAAAAAGILGDLTDVVDDILDIFNDFDDNKLCGWERECGRIQYDIQVGYPGGHLPLPPELKRTVEMAAKWWSRAIMSRPSRQQNRPVIVTDDVLREGCGDNVLFPSADDTVHPETVQLNTDLLVCVQWIGNHDDDGPTLASTQILRVDHEDGLPRIALIMISKSSYEVDGDRCYWTNIIAHEFGHALGFSRQVRPFRKLTGDYFSELHGTFEFEFLGGNATHEWRRMTGCHNNSFPPLEYDDSSHWVGEEYFTDHYFPSVPNCLENELMLPYVVDRGEQTPVSRMTLAAMEDLGYEVNYACAGDDQKILSKTTACHCGPPDHLSSESGAAGNFGGKHQMSSFKVF